jgi:hypothetical protein
VNDLNLVKKEENRKMTTKVYRILPVLIALIAAFTMVSMTAVAQQQMPQTTKETIRGSASIKTEQLHGTVEYVEGNTLLVRMTDGGIREFNVPEIRKFIIDGREVTVHDLKPGTKLNATVTTTRTPTIERTTTVGTGTVWWVAGQTVILTLPNGENREYKVTSDYKFNVDGNKEATVDHLRKGMKVSAQRIVEEPRTEIASDTVVTGQAPPPPAPKAVVAQATPAPAPRQEVAQARPVPAPAAAPAPAPAAAPVEVAQAQPAPAELPTTGSNLPLVGVLGVLFTFGGLGLRRISRAVKV